MLKYTVVLIPEEDGGGGGSVEVPALPGCITQGETREEAVSMAKEAIQIYIESLLADGEAPPPERGVETTVVEIAEPAG